MPSVLGYKPSHDGTVVLLRDGNLEFSIEAEKDSNFRHQPFIVDKFIDILSALPEVPDVLALGGWTNYLAGYEGVGQAIRQVRRIFGRQVTVFSSSHEKSHVLCAYALSPFPQGQPCYALVWEGTIGCFYYINEDLVIHQYPDVMTNPGWRYSYPYYLADHAVSQNRFWGSSDLAGKMMAVAAWPTRQPLTNPNRLFIDWILDSTHVSARSGSVPGHLPSDKTKIPIQPTFVNLGVDHPEFRNFAAHFSDALFDRFYRFAKSHLTLGYPLLISGGCGLNCDWNTKWKASGLFADVFVPPCANDSGSAIGTAVDAQHALVGNAKLKWSVYAGEEFNIDCPTPSRWIEQPVDLEFLVRILAEQHIVAWVQGRYEIGPRALGNRSLLAEPCQRSTTERLNAIKQREYFRPVAPICRREDVSAYFEWTGESPHMLYFQLVKDPTLRAITHDDRSARVQTVTETENARVHALLTAFKKRTGVGVLCNTSLNSRGRGFINRKSHLLEFAEKNAIECAVVNEQMFLAPQLAQRSNNNVH